MLTDSSVSAEERAKVAGLRVDTYLSDVAKGTTRLRRIPATLSDWLRRRGQYRLNQAGLIRAVELAQEVKARADSSAARDSTRPAPLPGPADTTKPAGAGRPATGG